MLRYTRRWNVHENLPLSSLLVSASNSFMSEASPGQTIIDKLPQTASDLDGVDLIILGDLDLAREAVTSEESIRCAQAISKSVESGANVLFLPSDHLSASTWRDTALEEVFARIETSDSNPSATARNGPGRVLCLDHKETWRLRKSKGAYEDLWWAVLGDLSKK